MEMDQEKGFQVLLSKVQRDLGFHGSQYKERCLKRRFNVRMRRHNMEDDFWAYKKLLEKNKHEYEELLKSLTINVTKFFRNLPVFEFISQSVLPEIFESKSAGQTIRIWSAGCASGEEPYSLAILAHEQKKIFRKPLSIHIIATDIDPECLTQGASGIYEEQAFDETPAQFKEIYFKKIEKKYKVVEEIQNIVKFRKLDLFHDAFPIHVDLICCRNVIIYFSRDAQVELIEGFKKTLTPAGFLVLGKTETMHQQLAHKFERINSRERVFKNKPEA